jgi:hypothetical protein
VTGSAVRGYFELDAASAKVVNKAAVSLWGWSDQIGVPPAALGQRFSGPRAARSRLGLSNGMGFQDAVRKLLRRVAVLQPEDRCGEKASDQFFRQAQMW